jgi:3-oxoacyl-[acyl-carrier-protein] synthase III
VVLARIVDIQFYIPQSYQSYEDIATLSGLPSSVVKEKLGITKKPVENKLGIEEMLLESAKGLLSADRKQNTKIVIYSGSDAKGKHVWTLAPKLGYLLELKRYYGFDVSSQCVGGIVGLQLATKLVSNGSYALLCVATKQSSLVNYSDPSSTFMFDFSDGAMSALIAKEEGKYEILSFSFLSDGYFGDVVYAEQRSNLLEVHEIPGWRDKMREESKKNFIYVIEEALSQAGVSKSKIGFVALVHMKRSFHRALLDTLGLKEEQSFYLENFGHMQGVDPFLAMEIARKQGKLEKGVVVLASAGTGWTWGASVLEVL